MEEMGESRIRAILNAMPHKVWSTRPDGFHDFYNDRWYQFTGVAYGSTDGEGWAGLFHPDDQPEAWKRWHHSLATGELYEVEYRLRRFDGAWCWHLGRARPIMAADGSIERWIGTCTDINELKEAENCLSLVAHELTHRIKNMFAVANAILTLGARRMGPDVRQFAAATTSRLDALSRIQDLIRPGTAAEPLASARSSLHDLVRALAGPHSGAGSTAVVISGDDADVSANRTTTIVLVLHELFTNALKHGALSVVDGRVSITTAIVDDWVCIDWCESGGPAIAGPPEHGGFGSDLSTRIICQQLGGTMDRTWGRNGLTIAMRIPANHLLD